MPFVKLTARQRHTAKRIFERLKEEHGFSGGYTIVKDYVRGEELRGREMFVPLVHPPGEARSRSVLFCFFTQPSPSQARKRSQAAQWNGGSEISGTSSKL